MPEAVVLDFYRQQLAAHGGGDGVRDMGLLQSALARPINAFYYNQVVSLSKWAACYAFIDGNKRMALVVAIAFIEANGFELSSSQEENYWAFYRLAAGEMSEDALAEWLELKMLAKA